MEVRSVLNSIQKNKFKMKRQNFYLSLSLFFSLSTSMFFLVTRLPPFKRDQIKYLVFDVSNVSKEQPIAIPSHMRSYFDRMISLD